MKPMSLPRIRFPLACLVLVLSLTACSGEDPDADVMTDDVPDATHNEPAAAAAPAAAPVASMPETVQPVAVAEAAITLGKSVQDNRVVKAARPQFTVSDTVYAGIPAGSQPPGSEARVYWTYQDGLSHKEETKTLGSDGAVFSFAQADGMKPGRYSVQIDVGPNPVGIVDFEVR
jgi:hypothetical protein